jgi:replicative DNA helicase
VSAGLRLLAAIAETGSTTTLRLLDPTYLVDDEETRVYTLLRNHLRRYGELPTVETLEERAGITLPETPEHLNFYIEEVHNRKVYNEVRDRFGELRNNIIETDIDAIVSTANAIRRACTPFVGQQQEVMTLNELATPVLEAYSLQAASPGFSGIPTGWGYLDRETGGYQNGDLVVWVARPGMGKTHLLIHQARTAWMAGRAVLFVSMEMTLTQIGTRLAAHHAGIDPDKLRKGTLSYYARRRFMLALEEFRDTHNFHFFAGNFKKTTDDLDILVQEVGPDIVYTDGMYLMKSANPAASRANRNERVAYVTDDLKTIALMRNRPIVATTQFSREAGKGGAKGSLENLGYTDALSTHASIILGIKGGVARPKPIYEWRLPITATGHEDPDGEYYRATTGHRDTFPTRLIEIMKGREGEHGKFGTHYAFAPLNISDAPLELVQAREDRAIEGATLDYMV